MRNLCINNVTKGKLPDLHIKHICFGYNEGDVLADVYTCSSNLTLAKTEQSDKMKWSLDLTEQLPYKSYPVDVTFLSLPGAVCVGLSTGEIFTVEQDTASCNLVGACDKGLKAMSWSPDQELLALVTLDNTMILMSCGFDSITEVLLTDDQFGEGEFITVGWGKKETQFHGSEGKQAAKVKVDITPDENAAFKATTNITWRGDGQLYAVGVTIDGIRRFKVFDRDGRLQYTSEKQPGLEDNLTWRPSGNVIATTQRMPNKYVIAFFEKNGLKHGDFTIPVNGTTSVKDISWSSDSEVLALLCSDAVANIQKVLVFTSSNYHWYLKQCLTYSNDVRINKLLWDSDFDVKSSKKLHVFLDDASWFSYNWSYSVDYSTGRDDRDDAVIAVIDGSKLMLSGFRQTVIPPPMAALELEVDFNINFVCFAPSRCKWTLSAFDSNAFFVCTENGKLIFYKQTMKIPLKYDCVGIVLIEDFNSPLENYHWLWVTDDTIICIKYTGECYQLQEYHVDYSNSTVTSTLKRTIPLSSSILSCHVYSNESSKVFLQFDDGEVIEYFIGADLLPYDTSFPVHCPKFNVLDIANNLYLLGLSHKNRLFLNDVQIMDGVSSFYVHSHFLLITTLQHVLLCIELTESGLKALVDYQKNPSNKVYKRKIERGSKLVIAVPCDTRTVFQLPRGNLEAIQPRPLSLKIIGEYLNAQKYHLAFDLMRKQRINLNLIYDHNPEHFQQHIDLFLNEIENNSWLSLFLSDLENVDVTRTMYASSYPQNSNLSTIAEHKVVDVCDTIRAHLEKRPDKESKILPLLTTYVKKNTIFDLEKALSVVKELKNKENTGIKLSVGSDEALKYLLYMVDVNQLYDVSLGMYDFDLVLLVANKSQKDPKEFIPMLNELNDMEENYKRFTINKHLKRFSRAVEFLAKCGPGHHEELKNFVKFHSLYRSALVLFSPDEDIYKHIADDFGSYLKLKKQYTEAAFVYKRGNNLDKAIDCFKEALEWELALELALSLPEDSFVELCWDLVCALKNEKRHNEALVILEQYYNKKDESIKYAVECGLYRTALRLCTQFRKDELKENLLIPALQEEFRNLLETISANSTSFTKHRLRLNVVRENKSKIANDFLDPSYANKDSDLYSDAGSTVASTASRGSSKTFRSSKNRRKHERKLVSLKEGSQYEDVALITALHGLACASYDLRHQVKEVNVALCCFNRDNDALTLQINLENLLKDMKDNFKVIWTNELVLEATNATIAAQNVPEGVSVLPQGISTLEPLLRISPIFQDLTSWKLEGLQ